MDHDTFWKIIDESRNAADDIESVGDALAERLQSRTADDVVAFSQILDTLVSESYRWDLWATAYIVNGGCSDDGFEYFRGWLIAQGRERFEAALANPEVVGDWAEPYECECEGILYAPAIAYEKLTGGELPPSRAMSHATEPQGESWDEDELENLYPDLCRKFFD